MRVVWQNLPWLMAMAVLVCGSAFFSASEAALFCLRRSDRRALASGTRSQRLAAELLDDPERLLSAVLFWNLVINIVYFALAAVIGLKLEQDPAIGQTGAVAFTIVALLTIIFFSEMMPKSLAVLQAKALASVVSTPLGAAIRSVDFMMPLLRTVSLLSRRVLWPGLTEEPYIDQQDLERAVELSRSDASVAHQERDILRQIVSLSDIRARELMRPRKQFRRFRAPVSIKDLQGERTPSGYIIVAEESGDVVSAVNLDRLYELTPDHLEHSAEEIIYVPWCSTVADALQGLLNESCNVAVVVNEQGETIGILTRDDILETVLRHELQRGERLLNRDPIHVVEAGVWQVDGVTNVRRLEKQFQVKLPETSHANRWGCGSGVIGKTAYRRRSVRMGWFSVYRRRSNTGRPGHPGTATARGWSGMIMAVVIFIVGLGLSAFFSGSETGFYRVTRVRLALDGLSGDPIAKGLLWLTNNPAMFVATTLVGNNVANYITSLAVILGTQHLVGEAPVLEIAAPLVLAPLVFVYGELLPKNLFFLAPNRLLRAGGPFFLLCGIVFLPVSGMLWLLARILQWIIGESPAILRLELARQELQSVLDEGQEAGILRPVQRELTQAVFDVADNPVLKYSLPPSRMTTVSRNASRSDVIRIARRHRSAVVLISGANHREIVGYVHVADVYLAGNRWFDALRSLIELQESDTHLTAITKLQEKRESIARVVDSSGRTVGIVHTQRLIDALLRTSETGVST